MRAYQHIVWNTSADNVELAHKIIKENLVIWKHNRSDLEMYLDFVKQEQNRKVPRKVNASTPKAVVSFCRDFKKEYGFDVPPLVGAAVLFHSAFVKLALNVEEATIDRPIQFDSNETIIENKPNWNRCVAIIIESIGRIIEATGVRKPEWPLTSETNLSAVLDYLQQDYEKRLNQFFGLILPTKSKLKRPLLYPLAKGGYLLVPADRINKATIEALAHDAMKGFLPDDLEAFDLKSTFWRAYSFSSGRRSPVRNMVVGVIGFKQQPEDRVWDILKKNSALAVKAQYALWARAYAETDAEPSVYISLTISQFCDDLGFKRKKEMHKLRNKQAAIAALELLTSLELVCVFQPPRGRTQRIRGPIWTRGVISEELVGYQDLFSEGSAGNFSRWVPKAFSYAPGAFFANDAWRAYNKFIAFVGEGLLKLSSENSDKYAVMVGGYLAILARMNSYQQSKVKVRTLVEKTGLWAVDRQKNPGRMESKLEKALDRLREVGVIKDWLITSSEEEIDPDNLDDERTLEGLSRPARWTKGWLAQSVIVDWPDVLEKRGKMLRENRSKQINKALKRSKKSNPTQ